MDMANGHGIAKPNAFRYGLTSGRGGRASARSLAAVNIARGRKRFIDLRLPAHSCLGLGWCRRKTRCSHLLVRRELGSKEVSHYYLSNASLDTPPKELLRVQSQRFFIEHSFREAKSECGMADYQARRWDVWHHHMALVMLGTLFLIK
jgi:hypothetical protein